MNLEKSDGTIRPKMSANKGARALAELAEESVPTKRNLESQSTCHTQRWGSVSQAADRIRQAATRNSEEKLTALLHHVNLDTLRESFYALRKDVAAGVDGKTWKEYEEGLEDRLNDLLNRVQTGAYRAKPTRRVEIPKADGGKRPLGITALEDRILQKVITEVILTPIFEPEFLGFSYGFRPGRKAHDALDALAYGIERRKVNWIIDADVQAFFDQMERGRIIRFLEHRIGDKRVIRLISKWLNAGVLENGVVVDSGRGSPQGSIISPLICERSHIIGYGNLIFMGT